MVKNVTVLQLGRDLGIPQSTFEYRLRVLGIKPSGKAGRVRYLTPAAVAKVRQRFSDMRGAQARTSRG